MFEWCENWETQLLNDDWKTIPNKEINKMIISCITGAARREIIPFLQLGAM